MPLPKQTNSSATLAYLHLQASHQRPSLLHLDHQLTTFHSTIVAINESLLALDTAMQNATGMLDTALKPVRETTAYNIGLLHGLYPLIVSMRSSVHSLRQAGF
ncbi:hypothetical protein ACQKWADRAFT_294092 [Trichoderma austrokoningii]